MTYDEIMKIEDVVQKSEKLKEYYINEIGINDWFIEKSEQKIRFRDRWEYKQNGVYHRLKGPAIDFINDGTRGFYYIDGIPLEYEEFKEKSKMILREKKLERTLGKSI